MKAPRRASAETSRLTVDLGAIVANWQDLRARHPAGAVAAVVKADAYGLGARFVAPALYAAGCRHFFVAHLSEALAIQRYLPGALLGVLNGLAPDQAEIFAANDLTAVLGSLAEIARWTAEARRRGQRLPALLHVDTGMNRLGLDSGELRRLADDPALLDGLDLRYVMTHLVASEVRNDPINAAQQARFAAACAALPAMPRSLANSSGIFLGPAFASDLARPGAALYGLNPTPGQPNPMRPVVRLDCQVLQVRQIAAGDSVGYNGTWRAARDSRIATIPLGYADGWPRAMSNRGHAIFDGAPVPLVGRVSMDLTTYDVTDFPAIVPGRWLLVIGPGRTPDDIAADAGTNGYEVLTSVWTRYAREYLS